MRKQIVLDEASGDNVAKSRDPQKPVLQTRQQHGSLAVHWVFMANYSVSCQGPWPVFLKPQPLSWSAPAMTGLTPKLHDSWSTRPAWFYATIPYTGKYIQRYNFCISKRRSFLMWYFSVPLNLTALVFWRIFPFWRKKRPTVKLHRQVIGIGTLHFF